MRPQRKLAYCLDAAELEDLDIGAGVHDGLGGAVDRAIGEGAANPALAAAITAAQDPDVGFQSAASRSRSAKPIRGQSWRMQSS